MKIELQSKCSACDATYSELVKGGTGYFIPWGSSFLCGKCHRLAIVEGIQAEFQPLFEILDDLQLKYSVGKAKP